MKIIIVLAIIIITIFFLGFMIEKSTNKDKSCVKNEQTVMQIVNPDSDYYQCFGVITSIVNGIDEFLVCIPLKNDYVIITCSYKDIKYVGKSHIFNIKEMD